MNELIEAENVKIEDMIYEIRGKQVMLDSDLAKLYKCKNGTKEINQSVKNNPDKFPERFSWILDENESKELLVKIFDQKKEMRGGRYNKPRVFTEQGVYMLATVLKSKVATGVSIKIMDAFVTMRHYIGNNEYRISNIETKVIELDEDVKELQMIFDKFYEKESPNELYSHGSIYDAYSRIIDIFNKAKNELIIIDSYADKIVLDIIRKIKVKVFLITKDSDRLSKIDIEKYNSEYDNLKVIRNNSFHDRYFILDKKDVYHSGASINNAGTKTFSINKLTDKIVIKEFVNEVLNIIKSNE